MINVSWEDMQDYLRWLNAATGKGYRLPTEAEWEYAARAGTTTPYSTGDCLHTNQANYDGTFPYSECAVGEDVDLHKTVPVGSYASQSLGSLRHARQRQRMDPGLLERQLRRAPPPTVAPGSTAIAAAG